MKRPNHQNAIKDFESAGERYLADAFDRIPRSREIAENLLAFAARIRETPMFLFTCEIPDAKVPVAYWDEAAQLLARHFEDKSAEICAWIREIEELAKH